MDLDQDGKCFHALKPVSNSSCAGWCITTHGWFHGKPIDLMVGDTCDVGNSCQRSVSLGLDDSHEVSESFEKTKSSRASESNEEAQTHGSSVGFSQSFGISFTAGLGKELGVSVSSDTKWETNMKEESSVSHATSASVEKAFSKSENHVTRHTVALGLSVTASRGGDNQLSYCGAWYAVPKVYL